MPSKIETTRTPVDPAVSHINGKLVIRSSDESPTTTSSSNPTSSTSDSENGSAGVAATQERSRQRKLGAVLVNLGAASEKDIFGSDHSAVMQAFREGKVPDLLVINRAEDDASRHPMVWYKPWTWFTSGAQVSPHRWDYRSFETPRQATFAMKEAVAAAQGTQTDVDEVESFAKHFADEADDAVVTQAAAAETAKKKQRLKPGLPSVKMVPLTEAEVDALTPSVRADRETLFMAEANIHKVLQGIEDTRYKYLVPSSEISCEEEVIAVTRCYAARNASAKRKTELLRKHREEELAKGFSNAFEDEDADKPIIFFDVLACGPKVKDLRRCTDEMTRAYSVRDWTR